jgi:thiol:disulfide interchange protein DsbA
MFRFTLILATVAGATMFGLQACSPGDVSAADTDAVETAAAQTKAPPELDVTATRKEAIEAAAPSDKLTRLDEKPAQRSGQAAMATGQTTNGAVVSSAANATAVAATASIIAAGDKQFRAGKDYMVLSPAKRTSSPPEKVELTEVFMYQCPHCFSFEPFVEGILQDARDEMSFVRLPAVFNNVAKLHAQAFYAAQSMGVWEKLHTAFFREIHTNRNLMPDEDKLLSFIASQGIDRDEFRKVMKSFEVDSKVRDAIDLNTAYQISSVPTLVVNGKYVTSGTLARSNDRLRAIVDYLIAKEAAAL